MLAASVILYLAITLVVGISAARLVRSSGDFALAGRRLPMFLEIPDIFATWFGAETLLGASAVFANEGMLGVIEDPLGASLCLILVGLFFARRFYRMNFMTLGDFYRVKFGKRVEVISSLFMVFSYLGWIAAQLLALALVCQTVFNIPLGWGLFLGTSVVLFYTMLGGLWSVSITDLVQTVVIVVGLFILAADLLPKAGGLRALTARTPDHFFNVLPEAGWRNLLTYIAAWMTVGLGSIPQQDVFQRVVAARSEKIAVRASLWAGLLYLTVAGLPLIIGLCAVQIYPDLAGEGESLLPKLVLTHAGLGLQILFFGALLSAILSTASGAILAPATVLARNLLKPYFPSGDDRSFLRLLRFSVVIVTAAAFSLCFFKSNIYELVGESSALSLVSLFVPMMAGLFWQRATGRGALWSMAAGMAAWLVFERIDVGIPGILMGLGASALGMVAGSLFSKVAIPIRA